MITIQTDPANLTDFQLDTLTAFIQSFRKQHVPALPSKCIGKLHVELDVKPTQTATERNAELERDKLLNMLNPTVDDVFAAINADTKTLDVVGDLQSQQDDHDAQQSFAPTPVVDVAASAAFVDPHDVLAPTDSGLDSAGQPWDAAIHSASKSKVVDGTWRIKRGLKVEPTPVPAPPATVASATVVTPPPPPAAVIAPSAPAPTTDGPTFDQSVQGYVKLVQYTAGATHSGHIAESEIAMICTQHGIASLALLTGKLELVPTIGAQIVAIVAARAP